MSSPLILFLDHSGELGGAELYLLDVLRHFRETSEAVIFQAGAFPDRLAEEHLPFSVEHAGERLVSVQRESALGAAIRSIPAVARLVGRIVQKARAYDVLYANSQKALIVGGLVSLITRRPLIWNLHDILSAEHFSSLNRRAATVFSNLFADHVIVNSQATLEAYRAVGGRSPASIVYNGIDAEPFDSVDPATIARHRKTYRLDRGPAVGVFSRLAAWKGQHVLIEALRQCPSWQGVIVGDALFQEDEAYAARLRQMTADYDIQDRVHFLGFRDDVPAIMHAVDAVAHTSTAPEPFGRVVVEGMLAGKPVIATSAGGPAEIIEHGETGLLFPAGDADALADRLHELTDKEARSARLAQKGHELARRQFSVEQMRTNIEEVIDSVLS